MNAQDILPSLNAEYKEKKVGRSLPQNLGSSLGGMNNYLLSIMVLRNSILDKVKPALETAFPWNTSLACDKMKIELDKLNVFISEAKITNISESWIKSKAIEEAVKLQTKRKEEFLSKNCPEILEQKKIEITKEIIDQGNTISKNTIDDQTKSQSKNILIIGGVILLLATSIILIKKNKS